MTTRFHIPREELRQLYYVKGWTQRQIAAHYGCTDSAIVRRMKKYSFQTRNRGDYYRVSPSCAELRELQQFPLWDP
jgi:transposase